MFLFAHLMLMNQNTKEKWVHSDLFHLRKNIKLLYEIKKEEEKQVEA